MAMNWIERFEKNFVKNPLGCWEWNGGITGSGYGGFWLNNKTVPAHRVSFEIYKDAIPEGLHIDHLCSNRKCVNPRHLEAVTLGENIRRGSSHNGNKAFCALGHPYNTENTAYKPDGRRYCRECNKRMCRERGRRKRDARGIVKVVPHNRHQPINAKKPCYSCGAKWKEISAAYIKTPFGRRWHKPVQCSGCGLISLAVKP